MIDIKKLSRSDIRYALYRCRTGNPEAQHAEIFKFYKTILDQYGLTITDFPNEWDIAIKIPTEIVSGHLLKPIKDKINESLFDEDGTLKE